MSPAYVAIDLVAEQFGRVDWLLTMDDDRVNLLTGSPRIRRISCPHDMKLKLTELVADIGRRSEYTYIRYNNFTSGLYSV